MPGPGKSRGNPCYPLRLPRAQPHFSPSFFFPRTAFYICILNPHPPSVSISCTHTLTHTAQDPNMVSKEALDLSL